MSSTEGKFYFRFFLDPPKITKRVIGPPEGKRAEGASAGRKEIGLGYRRLAAPPDTAGILVKASGFAPSICDAFFSGATTETAKVGSPTAPGRQGSGAPMPPLSPVKVGRKPVADPAPRFVFGPFRPKAEAGGRTFLQGEEAAAVAWAATTVPGVTKGRRHVVATPMTSVFDGPTADASPERQPSAKATACAESPWHRRPQLRHANQAGGEEGLVVSLVASGHRDNVVVGDDGGAVLGGRRSAKGKRRSPQTFASQLMVGSGEVVVDLRLPGSADNDKQWTLTHHRERRHTPAPLDLVAVVGSQSEAWKKPEWEGKLGRRRVAPPMPPTSPIGRKALKQHRATNAPDSVAVAGQLPPKPSETASVVAVPRVRPPSRRQLPIAAVAAAAKVPASAAALDEAAGLDIETTRGAPQEPESAVVASPPAAAATVSGTLSCQSGPGPLVGRRSSSDTFSVCSRASVASSASSILTAEDPAVRDHLMESWRDALRKRARAHARDSLLRLAVRQGASGTSTPQSRREVTTRMSQHSELW